MSTDPKPTKKATRKGFSAKTKEKAMQLLAEGELTQKQIAKKFGCSVNAIQQWKAKFKKSGASTPSTPKKAAKRVKGKKKGKKAARRTQRSNVTVIATKSWITFDEFARNYWNDNPSAADVLLLPPEIAPEAVRHINEVLRYAYEQLHG